MNTFYLDTSGLVKRYIEEAGSVELRALILPVKRSVLITTRLTTVEFHSAIAHRRREKPNLADHYDVVLRTFDRHSVDEYTFVELKTAVITQARELLDNHPLRAYDSIQLASALIANQTLIAQNLPPVIFISADNRLNDAAIAEGLEVKNPH